MERFVFVAAITFAIIYGIVVLAGGHGHGAGQGHGFSWTFNDDDGWGAEPVVAVSAGRLEAQTFAVSEIRVKNAAAHVIVIPEDRQDISVEITNPGHAPMPAVSSEDARVVIDGRVRGRIDDCDDDGVTLRGYGRLTQAEMPQITIHAPRRLTLGVGGASRTEVGAAASLSANFSGCGDATLGDVAEKLEIDLSGSGNIRAGAAQTLKADVAGSGEISTGAVADGADVSIAGSGTVSIAALNGHLSADGAGSGNLLIAAGAITEAKIDLAGSGDVTITASIVRLNADIVGSGDIDIDGVVGDITADIAGSGDITARSVTGEVHKDVWGSGDVHVGE